MSYRISWQPDQGFVSILTSTPQDALLLSAEFERKGMPPVVSELDGTPLTRLDLEIMAAAMAAPKRRKPLRVDA